jgi:ubiquinone/menaquinone biosynthesis C-methylase UbiE
MQELGTFDLVYSTFSMHHWEAPERSLHNLWRVLKKGGVLYIQDLKRVWWLYHLPIKGGFAESIRASFTPKEIRQILKRLGPQEYKIKTTFPFFAQSIIAWK